MKNLISPLLLILVLSSISFGWSTPPEPVPPGEPSMTLAGHRLFVSRASWGLDVYDISDPSSPDRLAHIPLDYSVGTAVKDDILYANDLGQVVVMRMTGDSYKVVARVGAKYSSANLGNVESMSCACSTGDFATAPSGPGTGSSFATFAVVDNQLYRVDYSALIVYDISKADQPKEISRIELGFAIETIYPTQDFLFIGGRNGMYIFDRSNPERPKQISQIEHVRACDPVVVSGATAFVTVRGGNRCGTSPDELLCVSIDDPAAPVVVGEKALLSPHGLAVRDSRLYVSLGYNGYSLLDVSNAETPEVEKSWADPATSDFIWSGDTLYVLLQDRGVKIYDVSNPQAPVLLSTLAGPAGS